MVSSSSTSVTMRAVSSEVKIVTVFCTVTAIFCALAYWGIQGRY